MTTNNPHDETDHDSALPDSAPNDSAQSGEERPGEGAAFKVLAAPEGGTAPVTREEIEQQTAELAADPNAPSHIDYGAALRGAQGPRETSNDESVGSDVSDSAHRGANGGDDEPTGGTGLGADNGAENDHEDRGDRSLESGSGAALGAADLGERDSGADSSGEQDHGLGDRDGAAEHGVDRLHDDSGHDRDEHVDSEHYNVGHDYDDVEHHHNIEHPDMGHDHGHDDHGDNEHQDTGRDHGHDDHGDNEHQDTGRDHGHDDHGDNEHHDANRDQEDYSPEAVAGPGVLSAPEGGEEASLGSHDVDDDHNEHGLGAAHNGDDHDQGDQGLGSHDVRDDHTDHSLGGHDDHDRDAHDEQETVLGEKTGEPDSSPVLDREEDQETRVSQGPGSGAVAGASAAGSAGGFVDQRSEDGRSEDGRSEDKRSEDIGTTAVAPAAAVVPVPPAAPDRAQQRAERDHALGKREKLTEAEQPLPAKPKPTTDKFFGSLGLFIMRLALAGVMAIYGLQKVMNVEGVRTLLTSTALRDVVPDNFMMLLAWALAVGELAIAAGLLFGFLTRFAGVGAALVGVGALVLVKWLTNPIQLEGGALGFAGSLELMIAAAGLLFLFLGAGRWSLDGALRASRATKKARQH